MTTYNPAAYIANHFDLTDPYDLFNALKMALGMTASSINGEDDWICPEIPEQVLIQTALVISEALKIKKSRRRVSDYNSRSSFSTDTEISAKDLFFESLFKESALKELEKIEQRRRADFEEKAKSLTKRHL